MKSDYISPFQVFVFDMDGTLFKSFYNWKDIRAKLQIKGNILEEIYDKKTPDHYKLKLLENFEQKNTYMTKPIVGVKSFFKILAKHKIKTVLNTNNNLSNTTYLLNKYNLTFDLIITREQNLWKPASDSFHYILDRLKCLPSEIISIGDSHYDILASNGAGIKNIYIIKSNNSPGLKTQYPYISTFVDYYDLTKLLQLEQCRHVDIE